MPRSVMGLLVGGVLVLQVLCACSVPSASVSPDPAISVPGPKASRDAVFDFYIGDLHDPAILAKYARVDILITDPSRFWGKAQYDGDVALLKAANPDIKIIGFFRSKVVREEWQNESVTRNTYLTALYEASRPYWSFTTTGDTLRDWPAVILFDPTNAEARQALRDVFVDHQRNSVNKLDGLFWDYFNNSLWISPDVTGMTGEPDLDGDGIGHWADADEMQAYQDSQLDSIREMRADLGENFIQIANGWRALQDSTFAGLLDGMFYELFPNVGFTSGAKYEEAMDLANPTNIFAASHWPRRQNGGPWLILSNKSASTRFTDTQGVSQIVNFGDVNRAIALLADCTSVHYDLSGRHSTGVPSVLLSLGLPLGPTTVVDKTYTREFERGRVVVDLTATRSSFPVQFSIEQDGQLVQALSVPTIYP